LSGVGSNIAVALELKTPWKDKKAGDKAMYAAKQFVETRVSSLSPYSAVFRSQLT